MIDNTFNPNYNYTNRTSRENPKDMIWFTLCGVFFPLIALILYFVWKDERPMTAEALLKGLKIYLIICVAFLAIDLLIVLFFVAIFVLGGVGSVLLAIIGSI